MTDLNHVTCPTCSMTPATNPCQSCGQPTLVLINPATVNATLLAEGYAERDIDTAYDSLVDAGLDVRNDANAITPEELDILRAQLDLWQAEDDNT